jgi:hypothetical protein
MHFAKLDEVAYLSPEMMKISDEIERVLNAGQVPAFFSRCVLKDEALKPGKNPRVFNILPATGNNWIGRIAGPLFILMRRYFAHFESAVGVDMSSSDSMRLVEALRIVQPALDQIEEEDIEKLDKSYTWEMWDAVVLAFVLMASSVGLDTTPVSGVLNGLKHCHYEIKGDVFQAPWNPSGQKGTVEVNGAHGSIGDRYLYYR